MLTVDRSYTHRAYLTLRLRVRVPVWLARRRGHLTFAEFLERNRLVSERDVLVYRLHLAGASQREIAREVGCAQSTVHAILHHADD